MIYRHAAGCMGVTYVGLMMTNSTEDVFQKKEQPCLDFHLQKKIEYKCSFIGNDWKKGDILARKL